MGRLVMFTVLALFCVLPSCISVSVTGHSTGDIKQEITNSLFYKNSKLFYPSETADDPRRIPQLSPEGLKTIGANLRDILLKI